MHMTNDECLAVVLELFSAYPSVRTSDDTVLEYVKRLRSLDRDDCQAGIDALFEQTSGRNIHAIPTVQEIRLAAQRARLAREKRTEQNYREAVDTITTPEERAAADLRIKAMVRSFCDRQAVTDIEERAFTPREGDDVA